MTPIGNGFIRRTNDGVPMANGQSGNIDDWRLATNDDAAAVETGGYFDALQKHMAVGSFIYASLDLDGTPAGKTYMVTSVTSGVTVAAL